ncbi:SCO family protein [Leptospira bouyouniensis]|uniref:Uncharacterized protein n=1 Tax=Leptospira bouyouniensis TaxID=2484911 RepID=A0ABY2LAP8_9LEPT|nr:SCO family protein [Leptospira bouyouniensis]TGK52294.1 hypothetical protein EHQ10_00620 [Leptospira bouyouniensis]
MKKLFNGRKQLILCFLVVIFCLALSSFIHFVSSSYRKIPCELCQESFQSEPKSNWILIYPGLVGCGKKCPMALEALRQFRERFPNTNFSFYFLITDPKESEEAISNYLKYYEVSLSIKALRPQSESEIKMYRRLGAYLPEHPELKRRDEHGTQFFLIPPNRTEVYALPKLEEKDWIQIQSEIRSQSHMTL